MNDLSSRDRALTILGETEGDPRAYARAMEEQYDALGSFFIDVGFGDVWARSQLNVPDRCVAVLAVLVSRGLHNWIAECVRLCLTRGLTPRQVREVVIQIGAYAGLPTGCEAMAAVNRAFEEDGVPSAQTQPSARLADDERLRRAANVMSTMTGKTVSAEDLQSAAREKYGTSGWMDTFGLMYGMGDVWGRGDLSRRQRSIAVVAALAAMGRVNELRIHIEVAARHGVSQIELEEVMLTLAIYGGLPFAVGATRLVQEVWQQCPELSAPSDASPSSPESDKLEAANGTMRGR